jgi:hypothetical protein
MAFCKYARVALSLAVDVSSGVEADGPDGHPSRASRTPTRSIAS